MCKWLVPRFPTVFVTGLVTLIHQEYAIYGVFRFILPALAMDSQGRGMVKDMIKRDALIKHASVLSNDIRSHWINQLDGGKLVVNLEMIV